MASSGADATGVASDRGRGTLARAVLRRVRDGRASGGTRMEGRACRRSSQWRGARSCDLLPMPSSGSAMWRHPWTHGRGPYSSAVRHRDADDGRLCSCARLPARPRLGVDRVPRSSRLRRADVVGRPRRCLRSRPRRSDRAWQHRGWRGRRLGLLRRARPSSASSNVVLISRSHVERSRSSFSATRRQLPRIRRLARVSGLSALARTNPGFQTDRLRRAAL